MNTPMGTVLPPFGLALELLEELIVGMLFYGESKDAKRIFFIALILSAAVGLKIIE